jgi:hypothetical protein
MMIKFQKSGYWTIVFALKPTNQNIKDMKAQKKLTGGIAVAIIAVLVASQSVNHAEAPGKVKDRFIKTKLTHSFSKEDVELLMKANHWTKQEAIKVLTLSNEAAENAQ